MEGTLLPSIQEMYSFTKKNHDMTVARNYEETTKRVPNKQIPTKRQHYLDDCIRYSCSPGPANKANVQEEWAKKPKAQTKRGEKQTYLDEITKRQIKLNFPSPNLYKIECEWPQRGEKPKYLSEKTTFINSSEYQSNRLPGPGAYYIPTFITSVKSDNKWNPHKPLIEKENKAAEMGTYNPCALQYNTFERMKRQVSHPNMALKTIKKQKQAKQNSVPGPGAYAVVNHWKGKQKSKKHEFSLSSLSGVISPRVYYS